MVISYKIVLLLCAHLYGSSVMFLFGLCFCFCRVLLSDHKPKFVTGNGKTNAITKKKKQQKEEEEETKTKYETSNARKK